VRHAAFLRGVNISGRVLKMDALRAHLTAIKLRDVETLIASGNVIFSSTSTNAAALEKRIEAKLEEALGYHVRTFVRSETEIAALAKLEPFTPARHKTATVHLVGFIEAPLDTAAMKTLASWCSKESDLLARGRELFWLCQVGQGASELFRVPMEKRLGTSITWRNMNTVRRIADRFAKG
jgi:uncharacterized protein (DUF1697 family)